MPSTPRVCKARDVVEDRNEGRLGSVPFKTAMSERLFLATL
jgi:hypothetical protein